MKVHHTGRDGWGKLITARNPRNSDGNLAMSQRTGDADSETTNSLTGIRQLSIFYLISPLQRDILLSPLQFDMSLTPVPTPNTSELLPDNWLHHHQRKKGESSPT
jgi:hypothetical protein